MVKKNLIKQFGLIGKNIDYSFSRNYFSSKFEKEKKVNHRYVNYDLNNINEFKEVLLKKPIPKGLNVTTPYKKEVIPFLDDLSEEAKTINAVNTIVWDANGKIIGHNTDHTGFEKSLYESINNKPKKALILGTGGAAGAIEFVLRKMDCVFHYVSRNPKKKSTFL
jgi:shikimate dehydrogenase